MTKQTVGKIFITSGLLSVVYCVVLYFTGPIKLQYGMLLNIILFSLDCIWFLSFGFLWAMFGVIILKGSDTYVWKIKIGGFSLIFTIIFLLNSYAFNNIANPHFNSSGRVVTFLFQSLFYITRPAITQEFIVSFAGIVCCIAVLLWFLRIFVKKIV